MDESCLRDFFEGRWDAQALAANLNDGVASEGQVSRYSITEMESNFQVEARHLAKVCEAFLEGNLNAEHLKTIGFSLLASDRFEWADGDEEVTSRVANEWAAPDINYEINRESAQKWRLLLLTGEDLFTRSEPPRR